MSDETFLYESADQCPDKAKHTKCPKGYLAWHDWAEKKEKTHDSTRCPTCGFFSIWKKKIAREFGEPT